MVEHEANQLQNPASDIWYCTAHYYAYFGSRTYVYVHVHVRTEYCHDTKSYILGTSHNKTAQISNLHSSLYAYHISWRYHYTQYTHIYTLSHTHTHTHTYTHTYTHKIYMHIYTQRGNLKGCIMQGFEMPKGAGTTAITT